jgi:hypothetical protein
VVEASLEVAWMPFARVRQLPGPAGAAR